MAVVIGLGVMSKWLRIPYPILLVLAGLCLGMNPYVPRFELSPEVVLQVFLPPLLYAAAFNTRWSDFRRQLRAISMLAIGLVIFTTALVGFAFHWLTGLPLAAGFVLGAIVSPPDAVAATAITQRLKVPRIVSTILEGESLVNDASALVAVRLAAAAVMGHVVSPGEFAGEFVRVAVGGIALGLVGGWLSGKLHRFLDRAHVGDSKLHIAITLLTPYLLFLPAEHLHVSGVLAVVSGGLRMGNRAEMVFRPSLMSEARAVWEMVEFLLNGVVFALIGLQLPVILENLDGTHSLEELFSYAAAVSGVVVVARIVWVFPGAYVPRWFDRAFWGDSEPYPPVRYVMVVAWAGMRGVVSLAAALALPEKLPGGQPFPGRDMILFLTFWVIFATLVIQGLTLPLVIRGLGVSSLPADEIGDQPARC